MHTYARPYAMIIHIINIELGITYETRVLIHVGLYQIYALTKIDIDLNLNKNILECFCPTSKH